MPELPPLESHVLVLDHAPWRVGQTGRVEAHENGLVRVSFPSQHSAWSLLAAYSALFEADELRVVEVDVPKEVPDE